MVKCIKFIQLSHFLSIKTLLVLKKVIVLIDKNMLKGRKWATPTWLLFVDIAGVHRWPAPFPGMLVRPYHPKTPWCHPNDVLCQYEMAYQLVLKSHQFPGINITWPPPLLLPVSPLAAPATLWSVYIYSWWKSQCWLKALEIYPLSSWSVCFNEMYRHQSGRCHSISLISKYFFIILPFQIFLLYQL